MLEFLGGLLIGIMAALFACVPYLIKAQREYRWAMDFIERLQDAQMQQAIRREELDGIIHRLHNHNG